MRIAPALFCISLLCCTNALAAQSSADSAQRSDPAPTARVLSRGQTLALGGATLATLALVPLDHRIQHFSQGASFQRNHHLKRNASRLAYAGGPGPFVAGTIMYVGGRTIHAEGIADLGVHLIEGVTLAASITALGKGLSGRSLPDVASGVPGEFEIGRGFHHNNGPFVAFPSGHTAAAFATAAVLTSEAVRYRQGLEWVVGPIAYTGASLVAASRVYHNVHWASDLPLAALIGTWSGNAIVRRQHQGIHNRLDDLIMSTSVVPLHNGGMMITWSSNALGSR